MAKDDNGIEPKARDGEPGSEEQVAELEVARRRARAQASDEEAAAAMGAKRGQPIDEQPDTGEDDDGQLFVWEQGRKVTLGTLITRGTPVEHAFVFGGKRLKGAGALVGFDDDVLIVTRGRVGKTSIVPTRDDEERVTKVVVETHIAAKSIASADSEQAMDKLAGVFAKRGIRAAA